MGESLSSQAYCSYCRLIANVTQDPTEECQRHTQEHIPTCWCSTLCKSHSGLRSPARSPLTDAFRLPHRTQFIQATSSQDALRSFRTRATSQYSSPCSFLRAIPRPGSRSGFFRFPDQLESNHSLAHNYHHTAIDYSLGLVAKSVVQFVVSCGNKQRSAT